jgi:hypothetical protein
MQSIGHADGLQVWVSVREGQATPPLLAAVVTPRVRV